MIDTSPHQIAYELRSAKRAVRRDPTSPRHADLTRAREAAEGLLAAGQLDIANAASLRVALRETYR